MRTHATGDREVGILSVARLGALVIVLAIGATACGHNSLLQTTSVQRAARTSSGPVQGHPVAGFPSDVALPPLYALHSSEADDSYLVLGWITDRPGTLSFFRFTLPAKGWHITIIDPAPDGTFSLSATKGRRDVAVVVTPDGPSARVRVVVYK